MTKEISQSPDTISPIPTPIPLINTNTFFDASSGVGLAFLVGKKWKVWQLLPGWQSDRHDIAWAKSIALELMAHTVVAEHSQHRHGSMLQSVLVSTWKKYFRLEFITRK